MTDVSIFKTTISVENPAVPGILRDVDDVMVDSGSEYTWVPASVLQALGIAGLRSVSFATADDRVVDRDVAFANV